MALTKIHHTCDFCVVGGGLALENGEQTSWRGSKFLRKNILPRVSEGKSE